MCPSHQQGPQECFKLNLDIPKLSAAISGSATISIVHFKDVP